MFLTLIFQSSGRCCRPFFENGEGLLACEQHNGAVQSGMDMNEMFFKNRRAQHKETNRT